MELLYNQKAKEKGCYMVGACGLDCVPNDMGVVYARQKFDGKLETRSSFSVMFIQEKINGQPFILY